MNIFIHYLDNELLNVYVPSKVPYDIIEKVRMSIKLALLLVGNDEAVYIPASNYYESKLAQIVLEPFRSLMDLYLIKLVSSSSTLRDFIRKKRRVYPSRYSREYEIEKEEQIIATNVPGVWTPRTNSATSDIILSWKNNVDSAEWHRLYKVSNYKDISSFEKDIYSVPEKLAQKAFLANHVVPKLKVKSANQSVAKEIVNEVISRFYIDSFLREFNAVCYKRFFLIPQADNILPPNYSHIDYADLCRKLSEKKYKDKTLYEYINGCDNEKLMLFKGTKYFQEFMLIDKHSGNIKSKGENILNTFIVHGHDEKAKLELKNYIQNTLKMDEPIVLAEKASGGLTIFEKFERYSKDINLVFVLLTPDDKYLDDDKSRARQNVIFEMGYFMGKLGRKSGQVILLYKGNLDLPTDISGLVYININNGIEAAGEEIRREISDLRKRNHMI